MKFLYKLISTWMLCGTIKKMPGTIGSLASFPLVPMVLNNKVIGSSLIIFLFLIGIWSINHYIKYYKTSLDPKEVVLDEVIGQLLTIFLVSIILCKKEMNLSVLLLSFFSFRFFDIIKPWPINLIDRNIKTSIGVMLDDIMAAIFASILVVAFCCLYYI